MSASFNDLENFEEEWTQTVSGLGNVDVLQMFPSGMDQDDLSTFSTDLSSDGFLGSGEVKFDYGNTPQYFLTDQNAQQQAAFLQFQQQSLQQQLNNSFGTNQQQATFQSLQQPKQQQPSTPSNQFQLFPNAQQQTTQSPMLHGFIGSEHTATTAPTMTMTPNSSAPSTPFNNNNAPPPSTPHVPLNTTGTGGTITEVLQTTSTLGQALERLRWEQKQLGVPLQRDPLVHIQHQQSELRAKLDWADKTLNNLLDTVLLDSNEMHYLLLIDQELKLLSKQLELYIQELQGFQKDTALPCYALHIVAQPFPDSVKQHKCIDEQLTVRLLTGAKFDTRPACTVKAEIINNNSKNTKKHTVTIENGDKLINESGIANFNDLKFPTGTRLKSIRVKFSARLNITDSRGGVHATYIESNPTNAVVVKTNENQWFEAEGILLKKTAFEGQTDITWCRFANWLQRRYLGATRQNLQAPVRPLSTYDLAYLHKLRFDSKPTINQKEFDNFWLWFGPLMHKIRYQRHISALWTRGYICGFLTREEVDSVLRNEQIGTFLIRFSERCDKFVVSYQSAESVKHYLLKNDDTHGAKKTLPDFLRDYKDFSCILQLLTDKNTQKRILRRCDKELVLKEFYSKKSSSSSPGYEDVIQVQ